MMKVEKIIASLTGVTVILTIASLIASNNTASASNDTALTRREDLEGKLKYPIKKQRVFETAHFLKKMKKLRKRNPTLYRRTIKEMKNIAKDPYKFKIGPNAYEGSRIGDRLDNIGALFGIKFRFYGSKNLGRSNRIVYVIDPPFNNPDEAMGIYSERMKEGSPLNCAIVFFDVGNHKEIYGKIGSHGSHY